jgi:hypothetical protein
MHNLLAVCGLDGATTPGQKTGAAPANDKVNITNQEKEEHNGKHAQ